MTIIPKPLLNSFKQQSSTVPPLWLMRQAGRYLPEYRKIRANVSSFLELCYTPSLAAEVTLQPIRRFHFDAAILFSDILVIPDALGKKVAFKENEGPLLEKVSEEKDLLLLNPNQIAKKLAPVYDAVARIKNQLPNEVTLIGFAGSPWTVATYMVEGKSSKDFTLTKTLAFSNPAFFEKLIEILVESTIIHLDLQIKAGAEVIQLFDSWAGILPEEHFNKWVIRPTYKIVTALKERHPNIPIIGFPRGAGFNYYHYATQTGVDAISLDQYVSPDWIKSAIPDNIVLQGNLDPVFLLGNQITIQKEIHKILTAFSGRPFIFNLGHGILPSTPIENVEFMIQTIRGKNLS